MMPNYKVNGNDGSAGNPYDRLGGNFSQIRNSGWSLGIGIQTKARVSVKKKKIFLNLLTTFYAYLNRIA